MAGAAPGEETRADGAVGEQGGERLRADLGDLVDPHGQDVGRQAIAEAGQRIDQGLAVFPVVEEHDRVRAARRGVGLEESAQAAQQRVGRRERVSCGARRAHRRALAAPGADMGIDGNVVAGGRDGAGRAQVETAGAAGDAGARMGAQALGEGDEARLVELADEVRGLEQEPLHRRRVARVGPQVAGSQLVRREQGRAAGEIQDEVAGRGRPIARRAE